MNLYILINMSNTNLINNFESINILKFNQIKKCICNIYNKSNIKRLGFFCKISFPDKFNLLPFLITSNNILSYNDIGNNKIIKISIDVNNERKYIKVDNTRKIYISKKLNIIFIEIKENVDKIYDFL